LKFAIVAVEYFTKWTKAEPITKIDANNVQIFFLKNIVCRFSVPKEVILDNVQFDSTTF
jgi:hypothetical protein